MLAERQQEEILARRVFDLGKTHCGLVYQRMDAELALVRDPNSGKVTMRRIFVLTDLFLLTQFGVARYKRHILTKVATPVNHTLLSELDEATLIEINAGFVRLGC